MEERESLKLKTMDRYHHSLPFTLVKQYKRLKILDGSSKVVYTPPDFLRHKIVNRSQLQKLCDEFNEKGYNITSIIEFESSIHP